MTDWSSNAIAIGNLLRQCDSEVFTTASSTEWIRSERICYRNEFFDFDQSTFLWTREVREAVVLQAKTNRFRRRNVKRMWPELPYQPQVDVQDQLPRKMEKQMFAPRLAARKKLPSISEAPSKRPCQEN